MVNDNLDFYIFTVSESGYWFLNGLSLKCHLMDCIWIRLCISYIYSFNGKERNEKIPSHFAYLDRYDESWSNVEFRMRYVICNQNCLWSCSILEVFSSQRAT